MAADNLLESPKHIRLWSLGAIAIRALSLIPSTIDTDESWFSASAAALSRPWDYFQTAIDNKPPGTIWFYWLVGKGLGTYPSPRLVRGFSILGLWLASRAVCRLVRRLGGSELESELAGLFAIVASSVLCPQVMATTNEGLLVLLLSWALVFALGPKDGKPGFAPKLLAGVLIGLSLLVKQTAILLALPILAAPCFEGGELGSRRARALGVAAIVAGAAAAFIPLATALGWHELVYWTWDYPRETLVHARAALFNVRESLSTLALVLAAWLPLLWGLRIRNRFVLFWLAAAGAAVIAGRGLFPHYYLLLVPPLSLAAALSLKSKPLTGWRAQWLGIAFAGSVLVASWPSAGLFWGVDARYNEELSKRIEALTGAGDRLWVWGGTATPLSESRRSHTSAFLTGRFLVPPYTTPAIRERFEREFSERPPEVVLDLHERKDNRFDFPTSAYPWLQSRLERDYFKVRDPSLPWAIFFVRKNRPYPTGWRTELDSEERLESTWNELVAKFGTKLLAMDHWARARMSLALLGGRERVDWEGSDPRGWEQKAVETFSREHLSTPFPLKSEWWWVSWAIVKFQPGTVALAAPPCQDLMAFTWMLEIGAHSLKRVGGGNRVRHDCNPLPKQTEPPNARLELISKTKETLFREEIFVPLTRNYSLKSGHYVPGPTPEPEPVLNLEIPWRPEYEAQKPTLRITRLDDGTLLAEGAL